MTKPEIAIVDYPGALPSAVYGIEDMLSFGPQGERWDLHRLSDHAEVDFAAIILPPSKRAVGFDEAPWLIPWLRHQTAQGALVCSACAGLSWVAAAGLDRGRRVTTHWGLEQRFRDHFPELNLDTAPLLIEHSDLITAGGMMAWIDLSLVIIERLAGQDSALDVARNFIVSPNRRDQRRFRRFLPELRHGDAEILRAQHYIDSALQEPLKIADLADIAGLAPRSFLRRFTRATGLKPTEYLQALRVDRARDLLLQTRDSTEQIGFAVGYTDSSAFQKIFKRLAGQSPAEFRRAFRQGDFAG